MNVIINPDNTILDINKKYEEINEYVAKKISSAMPEDSNLMQSSIESMLLSNYDLFKSQFGKSKNSYIMAIASTLFYVLGYESAFEFNDDFSFATVEDMICHLDWFNELFTGGYEYLEGARELIVYLAHLSSEDRVLFYGTSKDDLDEYKAQQIIDDYRFFIFDDIYNLELSDRIAMEHILLSEGINPEDTIFVTADITEANMAGELGLVSYYVNAKSWEDGNKVGFVNTENNNFTTITSLNELYSRFLEAV